MRFTQADKSIQSHIDDQYGAIAARHLHFEDGFTLAALDDSGRVAGFISFVWRDLVCPLDNLQECFIDIIETSSQYRRMGIARKLISMGEEIAKAAEVYQIRAWSSSDKVEALSMWGALGFGLAPAVVYPGGVAVHGYYVTRVLQAK